MNFKEKASLFTKLIIATIVLIVGTLLLYNAIIDSAKTDGPQTIKVTSEDVANAEIRSIKTPDSTSSILFDENGRPTIVTSQPLFGGEDYYYVCDNLFLLKGYHYESGKVVKD